MLLQFHSAQAVAAVVAVARLDQLRRIRQYVEASHFHHGYAYAARVQRDFPATV